MKKSKNKLLQLFLSTLYLSAFTFGGGYVIITLMKQKFVDTLHWIDEEEMLDLVAIAQSAPGAIAINGAIVVGYKIAGFKGILVTILGTIIPPFLIISVISYFYQIFQSQIYIKLILEGMQSGVSALIACVVYDMAKGILIEKDILSYVIMFTSFIATYYFNINVVYVIIICIVIGVIRTFLDKRRSTL